MQVRCGREETQIDHEEARRDGGDSRWCVPEDRREGEEKGEKRTMR